MAAIILPAPTGGWNARDPIDALAANEAIELVNVFPDGQICKLRGGFESHATVLGAAGQALFEHADPDGTKTFIACANNKILDVTAVGAATDITGTTAPTNNAWNGHQFNGKLILLNGTNQPQQVDKTVVSDATFTGIGDDSKLIQGCGYKNRQYLIESGTQSVWYGGINAITGALTEFPVGSYLTRGSYLQWATSYSRGLGQLSQDMLVIAGELGDILLYAGDYPGNSWELVGRYQTGETLGRRSFVHIPGDLLILTTLGITSVNSLMSGDQFGGIAYKINPEFAKQAAAKRTVSGWHACRYDAGRMLLINVPRSTTESDQFVLNLQTGAACKFTGWSTAAMAVLDGDLYFCDNAGAVQLADYGQDDGNANIELLIKWPFNYFGKPGQIKQFLDAALIVQSDTSVNLGVAIDVDYQDSAAPSDVAIVGDSGTPWGSSWGSAWSGLKRMFRKNAGLRGTGFCGALKIYAEVRDVELEISAAQVRYSLGGEL